MDEISIVLPRVLDGRLRALARLCGRDEKDIIRVALDDYLGRVTILSQPVQYQLPDGLWVVEALEKALEAEDGDGNPTLLVRFYGTLKREDDKGDRLLTAMVALKGLTERASTVEMLGADWLSMKRGLGL